MYVVVAAIQLACCGGSGSSRPQCCVGAVGGMLGAYKQDTLIDLEFASKFTTKPMKASSQIDSPDTWGETIGALMTALFS